jgi:hypothetical protein
LLTPDHYGDDGDFRDRLRQQDRAAGGCGGVAGEFSERYGWGAARTVGPHQQQTTQVNRKHIEITENF